MPDDPRAAAILRELDVLNDPTGLYQRVASAGWAAGWAAAEAKSRAYWDGEEERDLTIARLRAALLDALELAADYAGSTCMEFCVHGTDDPESCPRNVVAAFRKTTLEGAPDA